MNTDVLGQPRGWGLLGEAWWIIAALRMQLKDLFKATGDARYMPLHAFIDAFHVSMAPR